MPISSAATSAAFRQIDKIAMLSYLLGASGVVKM